MRAFIGGLILLSLAACGGVADAPATATTAEVAPSSSQSTSTTTTPAATPATTPAATPATPAATSSAPATQPAASSAPTSTAPASSAPSSAPAPVVTTPPAPTPAPNPTPVQTTPSVPVSKYVFVVSGGIHVYAVNAGSGGLTEVPGSPFAFEDGQPPTIQVQYDTTLAYGLDPLAGPDRPAIALYDVAANGAWTWNGTLDTTSEPTSILIDPSGAYLYAYMNSQIVTYTVGSAGGLTQSSAIAAPVSETPLQMSTDGTTLYDGTQAAFSVSAGVLTPIQNPAYPAYVSCQAAACAVNYANQTLYQPSCLGCASGNLMEYDYSFAQKESQAFTFGTGNFQATVDVSGTYVYQAIANTDGSTTLTCFTIGSSGALQSTGNSIQLPQAVLQVALSN